VGLRMMDLLAERLGSTSERMAEVANKEVLSRLASQILRLVEEEGVVDRRGGYSLPDAYTHEELGAMVGAGRVAVTRVTLAGQQRPLYWVLARARGPELDSEKLRTSVLRPTLR
jgi:CRP-like cAMP-binding protein